MGHYIQPTLNHQIYTAYLNVWHREKKGGGSSCYGEIFKSNERNGEEGLKDNVLRQRENFIWPKVETVVAKMKNGIALRTYNKTEQKNQWKKIGSVSKKQIMGGNRYLMPKTLLAIWIRWDRKLGAMTIWLNENELAQWCPSKRDAAVVVPFPEKLTTTQNKTCFHLPFILLSLCLVSYSECLQRQAALKRTQRMDKSQLNPK